MNERDRDRDREIKRQSERERERHTHTEREHRERETRVGRRGKMAVPVLMMMTAVPPPPLHHCLFQSFNLSMSPRGVSFIRFSQSHSLFWCFACGPTAGQPPWPSTGTARRDKAWVLCRRGAVLGGWSSPDVAGRCAGCTVAPAASGTTAAGARGAATADRSRHPTLSRGLHPI